MPYTFSQTKTALLASLFTLGLLTQANAQAGIFEVIHPEVEKGEIEIEALHGIDPSGVEEGEARSAHEFAIGYGITDFWKFTAAVELENPRGESLEVEGFEIENLFLIPGFNKGHDHDHENHKDGKSELTLGFYSALEISRDDGISDGALEIGPVFETNIGNVDWVGNLFLEIPFSDGDPGIAYASQLVLPVHDNFGIGVENFGEFEGAFGNAGEQEHRFGPALYVNLEIGKFELEPRAAVLFDVGEEFNDPLLSFNIEYKIGG